MLRDFSTPALIKALQGNLHAQAPFLGRMPHSTYWQEPGFIAVITALGSDECHVYLSQFEPQAVETRIKDVVERFRSNSCLPFYWHVCASTLPTDMGRALEKNGFQSFARPPGMAVDLEKLKPDGNLPDGFVIEPVRTGGQLRDWVDILAKVDALPDALRDGFWQMFHDLGLEPEGESQLFLGMENGVPVAGSRLFSAAGVAGIWHVSTLPEARGKGYGTAMTLAVAHAGQEMGYRFGVLFATPAGQGVYRRLGFQDYFHIEVFKSPEQI